LHCSASRGKNEQKIEPSKQFGGQSRACAEIKKLADLDEILLGGRDPNVITYANYGDNWLRNLE